MEEERYIFLLDIGKRECPTTEAELLENLAANLKKLKMNPSTPEECQSGMMAEHRETSYYNPFDEEKKVEETSQEWIERDPIKAAEVRKRVQEQYAKHMSAYQSQLNTLTNTRVRPCNDPPSPK